MTEFNRLKFTKPFSNFLETLWKEDFFKKFLKKQEIDDIASICDKETKENGGSNFLNNDIYLYLTNDMYFLFRDDPTSFTVARLNKQIKFKKKKYSYTQIYTVDTWDDKSKIDFSLREDKVEEIKKIILEEYKRTFPERFETSPLMERRDYSGNQIEKITMEILSRKLDYWKL